MSDFAVPKYARRHLTGVGEIIWSYIFKPHTRQESPYWCRGDNLELY